MRLLNLRINFFFIYYGLFFLILVVFVLFLLSLRFGQISPLSSDNAHLEPQRLNASIHPWSPFGARGTADRGVESIADRGDRQQLWKAVITGDTVTRLSIPIRGRGKITWRRPETLVFEHWLAVNEKVKPPDNINRCTVQRENRGTLVIVWVVPTWLVSWIVNLLLSNFLFSVLISVGMKYICFKLSLYFLF